MLKTTKATTTSPLLNHGLRRRRAAGFSLIEVLTVLMIVGFLASISVSLISGISGEAGDSRHRRNAQTIANIFITGETVGAGFLVPGDIEATISNIVTGTVIASGLFEGQQFAVPGLSEHEQTEAARYLVLSASSLTYNPGA